MSGLRVDGEPIDYSGLPEHLRDGVRRYMDSGVRPGSFLCAVISNDLVLAFRLADDGLTLTALQSITRWFIWHAPQGSFGSASEMDTWILGRSAK